MTPTTETTIDLSPLRDRFTGDLHTSTDPGWDEARSAWNLAVDQHPGARRDPRGRRRRRRGRSASPASTACASPSRAPATTPPLRHLAGRPAAQDRAHARRQVDAAHADAPGSAPASPGARSSARPPSTASPRSPGSSHDVGVVGYTPRRRRRLAGAQARPGRRAASPRSRSSPPTASCARVDADTTPTCSGRSAAAAATSASSPRSSSSCCRSPRCTPARCSSRSSAPARCSRPGGEWTPTVPDEVTSVGRMLQFPPIPDIPEPLRGHSFVVIEAAFLGTERAGRRAARAAARARSGDGHVRDRRAAGRCSRLHMDPPGRFPGNGDHQMLADLDAESLAAPRRGRRPGHGLAAALVRVPPPRRGARASRARGAARWARSTAGT